MKKLRKVNVKNVLTKTLAYRIFVILLQGVFTYFYVKNWSKAFNISIIWNIANIFIYLGYEYIFSKKWDTIIQTTGCVIWLTGLPCSGKTTIGDSLAKILKNEGYNVERLDGDIVRNEKLSDDLRYSKEDRDKNINRISFVCKLLSRNKTIVIASFVSPYKKTRNNIRNSVTNFIEVFVKASPEKCSERDVKGMWKKAKEGKIKNFTGYSAPYEEPLSPEIVINTEKETVKESVARIIYFLRLNKFC